MGVLSVCGSACWAIAFTLQNAAKVRTFGQVELLFTFVVARVFLKKRHSRQELLRPADSCWPACSASSSPAELRRSSGLLLGGGLAGAAFLAAAFLVARAFFAGAPPFSMIASRRIASSS